MMKVGLNVGSGERQFSDVLNVIEWVNIDKVSRPGEEPNIICDGTKVPFEDGTVDYVVLHHVLEHFGCGEGRGLILEAHRVLRPGGSLLVFVPDLRKLAKWWLDGGIETQIYVTNLYGAYRGDEESRHKWGFDEVLLHGFLRDGRQADPTWWKVTGPFDWRTIPGADIARDDRWILGAECVK